MKRGRTNERNMLTNVVNGAGVGALPEPGTYAAVGWLCFALMCIIIGLRQGIGFWRDMTRPSGPEKRTLLPSPLEIQQVKEMAREQDCMARHEALQEELNELKKDIKSDVGELHEKVNGVAREVSELTASGRLLNQQLSQISLKLDRMNEEDRKEARNRK